MPTALELTREEWQPYIEVAKRRLMPPQLSLAEQQQRDSLLARVREAAVQLKTQFSLQRVVLFGSLASANGFISDSDVDLAVEGLSKENFWDAWRVAETIVGDRPVDLIEIETASESLQNAIETYGIDL